MNVEKKKRVRLLTSVMLVTILLISLLLPAFTAYAEVHYPKEAVLYIHKVHFDDLGAESAIIKGNGTELRDLQGATPQVGIQFNVIEVRSLEKLGENPSQEEAARYYDEFSADDSYRKTSGVTDENGVYKTESLPAGTYLIYQVNDNIGTKQSAVPVVVTIPMMNPDGKSWNENVHVYIKDISTLGAAQLYKYSGEKGQDHPLAGAKFTLYRVGAEGEKDSVIEADLITGDDGFTHIVSNLLIGEYYFQETSAPDGYLLNGNRYSFTVGAHNHAYNADGKIDDSKVIKVGAIGDKQKIPNYLAPTLDKVLETSSSASIGEINRWTITADIPANIMEYTQFVITDLLDSSLKYVGNIAVKVDGSALNPAAYRVATPTGNSQLLTVTIIDSSFGGALKFLAGRAKLSITFETVINQNAKPGSDIPNSATLQYHNGFVSGSTNSIHIPSVATGGRKFLKTNTSGQTLADAHFKIYRIVGGKKQYVKQDSSLNITWVDTIADGTVFISRDNGQFEIRGLAYGDYYLEEIKAPRGYNLLRSDVHFVVDKLSYEDANTITIQNSNEPVIPVTGGIGTTLFYIIGALIMFIALMVRKKKQLTIVPDKM